MKYKNIKKATFLTRENRFIATINIDGKEEKCHVKNTGRCKELLKKGAEIYVEKTDNESRKTKYSLITVKKGDVLFNIDSQAPNKVYMEYIKKYDIYGKDAFIKAEKTYGNSRFDIYVKNGEEETYIEIKGVTLEVYGKALFPDAPTERGVKHLKELAEIKKEGKNAEMVFILQFLGAKSLSPNWETHKEFGQALKEAREAGVKIKAFECSVKNDELEVLKEVQVII